MGLGGRSLEMIQNPLLDGEAGHGACGAELAAVDMSISSGCTRHLDIGRAPDSNIVQTEFGKSQGWQTMDGLK